MPTWRVAARPSRGSTPPGPRPSHARVRLMGQPTSPRLGPPWASLVPGIPRRTRGRQVPGAPTVPPPARAARPRRPLRVAPSRAHVKRSERVAPARLATVAWTLRGATTTPAQPATALAPAGRSSRAAAPLPPLTTARIAGRAGMAAAPMHGKTVVAAGRPSRAMVAAMRPPAATGPRGPPTAAEATRTTPAETAVGVRSTVAAAGATRPSVPVRPPVRAPRAGMPGTTTTFPRRCRLSWASRVPL